MRRYLGTMRVGRSASEKDRLGGDGFRTFDFGVERVQVRAATLKRAAAISQNRSRDRDTDRKAGARTCRSRRHLRVRLRCRQMRCGLLGYLSDDVVTNFFRRGANGVFDRSAGRAACVTMQLPRRPKSGAPPYVS